MNDRVREELLEIEQSYQVKILYAVESGSRAWGFPSKDSDYDVRFIYIHQPEWYLSIDPQGVGKKRDVIEQPISDLLDISGWEITKALRLFRKNNPSLLEWLKSDIVYYQQYSFIDRLRQLETEVFSPNAMLHHYLHMARGNYREYLKTHEVKIKKYFYVLRPILACQWIIKHKEVPPLLFQTLLEKVELDETLRIEITKLLQRKIQGDELDIEPRIQVINDFLELKIEEIDTHVKSLEVQVRNPTDKLDELFRGTLKEIFAINLSKRT